MEIVGKVHTVLQEVTGQGRNGTWKKRDFVIETEGQYPKKVCFTVWGDKSEPLENLQPGSEVKVFFDPESREYNGRWYTDLKAWRFEAHTGGSDSEGGSQADAPFDVQVPPTDDDSLPF